MAVSGTEYRDRLMDALDLLDGGRKGAVSENTWLKDNYRGEFLPLMTALLNSPDPGTVSETVLLLASARERSVCEKIREIRLRGDESVRMACDGYFHVLEEDDAAIPGLFDTIEHKDGDSFAIAARKLSAIARKEDLQRIRKTYGHVYGPMRKEMEKVLESVILRNPELERNRDLYFSVPVTPDEKAFGRFAENAEDYLDIRYRNNIFPKRIISESVAANVSSALKKIEIRLYNEADNLQYYGEDKAGTFDSLLELLAWASSDLSEKTLSRDGRAGAPDLHLLYSSRNHPVNTRQMLMAYGGFRDRERPKEMFNATCSDCGKECEVPFRPTQGKPVYCRECFRKHRPAEVDRSRF